VLFGWQYAVIASIATMAVSPAIDLLRVAFNTSVYVLATFLSAMPAFVLGWDGAGPPGWSTGGPPRRGCLARTSTPSATCCSALAAS
jgi:hypothetical protein